MQVVAKRQPDGGLMIYALYTDVSELHDLRGKLQEQRDMLAAAMEHSGMCSWIYEFDTQCVTLESTSKAKVDMPALLSHSACEGEPYGQIHDNGLQQYDQMLQSLKNGAARATLDLQITMPRTKEQRWQRVMYTVVSRAEDGMPEKAIGTALDITEQKIAEQNYAEETAYLNALSTSLVSSYRINLSTGVVEEAHSLLHLIEEPKSIHFDDASFEKVCNALIPLERERKLCCREFCPTQLKWDYENGKIEKTYEYPASLRGSKVRWLSLKVKMMRNPLTDQLIAFFTFWDISREKQLQQVIDCLMQTNFDAICLLDARTGEPDVLYGNGLDEVVTEQQRLQNAEEGVKSRLWANCHPDDVEQAIHDTAIENVRAVLATKPLCRVSYRTKQSDGIHYKRVHYRYLDEEHLSILCTIQDDTDLHEPCS